MPDVSVQIRDMRFWIHGFCPQRLCRQIISTAWQGYEPAEVSVVLANDAFVHVLNRDYRGKDCPTNVLSFENAIKPPKGQPWLAGDIIIAYQTVRREARAQDKSFREHLTHLLIHGALHLQGYDHLTPAQARKMESLEIRIMKNLGYDNPYRNVE